jgi:hypothetical protein
MAQESEGLELIGWQWRFAFPTHKGDWHSSRLPQTIPHGHPVSGHSDCCFETRCVYAGPVGAGAPEAGEEKR